MTHCSLQGSLGVSVSTGYNWGEVTSEARGEEEEFSVETSVPGGRSIRIQQTVGSSTALLRLQSFLRRSASAAARG